MKILEILKYISETPNSAFYYTPPIYDGTNCYFFKNVISEIKIFSNDDIELGLQKIDENLENNLTAFGFINYEFGYLLEQRLEKYIEDNSEPLLHFLFCEKESIEKIDSKLLDYSGIENLIGEQVIDEFRINTSKREYLENIEKIKNYINEGDTYQVNYTVNSEFKLLTSIEQLFAQLIFTQSTQYSAIINLGNKIIISASPELFFEIENDTIKVKPMKGTIRRGKNLNEDEVRKNELFLSTKDRAENIMIVDLLRNDLGKICEYGSVVVNRKYNLETYESVHQLTSDVEGKLKTNKISVIIKNLFPSGSITGAPKIRTMEIIKELEKEKRGVYTGLIGIFDKEYSTTNVAIRTLTIDSKNNKGSLGIGSGIVWDSNPEDEYDEVILKSKFLTEPTNYFELFETMLFEEGKIFLFQYHLKRMKKAAEYFLFRFDEKKILTKLLVETNNLDKKFKYKIKMKLNKWGNVNLSYEKIEKELQNIDVIISEIKINSLNKFQYFKTTNRKLYDDELIKYKNDGFTEVIFINEKGNVTEGSFTNVIIESDKKFITPPVEDGILNGCYRQYLLENDKNIAEACIDWNKLISSKRIILANSVRKKINIKRIFDAKGNLLKDFSE